MSSWHPLLTEFQKVCQQHYACFSLSAGALERERLRYRGAPEDARLFIADQPPERALPFATLLVKDVVKYSERNGHFSNVLAKAMLVTIFAEWDEFYRPEFARALGLKTKQVHSDLMGDVRKVRNCIVHNRSVVSENHGEFKVLNWNLTPGELLITNPMTGVLMNQINTICVVTAS